MTKKELTLMTKENLLKFCNKYNIYYSGSSGKSDFIKNILDFIENGGENLIKLQRQLSNFPAHPILEDIKILPFYKTIEICPEQSDLNKLNKEELKNILRYYGAILGGKKSILIDRINDILDINSIHGNIIFGQTIENYIAFIKYFDDVQNTTTDTILLLRYFGSGALNNRKIEKCKNKIREYREEISLFESKLNNKIDKLSLLETKKYDIFRKDIKTNEPIKEISSGFIYLIKNESKVKIGYSTYKDDELLKKYLHKRYHTVYGFDQLDEQNFRYKFYTEKAKEKKNETHIKYAQQRFGNSELFTIDINAVELP